MYSSFNFSTGLNVFKRKKNGKIFVDGNSVENNDKESTFFPLHILLFYCKYMAYLS